MRKISVYRITNIENGRVYVGQSVDPDNRYNEHRRSPPSRMVQDAQRYKPFTRFFIMDILLVTADKQLANNAEQRRIALWKCTGPMGYNILKGAPKSCKKFWGIMHNKKL